MKVLLYICVVFVICSVTGCHTFRWAVDRGFMVKHGHELYWEKSDFPLKVYVDMNAPAEVLKATTEAVIYINQQANATLFLLPVLDVYRETAEFGAVWVRQLPGRQDKGTTSPGFDADTGRIVFCYVQLPVTGDYVVQYKVALHEFLHVLGFDHDDIESSIMYPQLMPNPQYMTRKDSNRLRRRYGDRD